MGFKYNIANSNAEKYMYSRMAGFIAFNLQTERIVDYSVGGLAQLIGFAGHFFSWTGCMKALLAAQRQNENHGDRMNTHTNAERKNIILFFI